MRFVKQEPDDRYPRPFSLVYLAASPGILVMRIQTENRGGSLDVYPETVTDSGSRKWRADVNSDISYEHSTVHGESSGKREWGIIGDPNEYEGRIVSWSNIRVSDAQLRSMGTSGYLMLQMMFQAFAMATRFARSHKITEKRLIGTAVLVHDNEIVHGTVPVDVPTAHLDGIADHGNGNPRRRRSSKKRFART